MGVTKVEWTATIAPDDSVTPGYTFNPWYGCTKISPACDHCYAEGWAKRSGIITWGGERKRTKDNNWLKPIKWNRQAWRDGVRRKVFCASLGDVFDNQVPEDWRLDLWELIANTEMIDWLLLGPVDIYRAAITAATRLMLALKLSTVLS